MPSKIDEQMDILDAYSGSIQDRQMAYMLDVESETSVVPGMTIADMQLAAGFDVVSELIPIEVPQ